MSEFVQLLGMASISAAAWSVNRPLGLLVTGLALFVVGLAIDGSPELKAWRPRRPKFRRRRRRERPPVDAGKPIREYYEDVQA